MFWGCGRLLHFFCVLHWWRIVNNNNTLTNQVLFNMHADFWVHFVPFGTGDEISFSLSIKTNWWDSYVIGHLLSLTKATANHITVSCLFVLTDRGLCDEKWHNEMEAEMKNLPPLSAASFHSDKPLPPDDTHFLLSFKRDVKLSTVLANQQTDLCSTRLVMSDSEERSWFFVREEAPLCNTSVHLL